MMVSSGQELSEQKRSFVVREEIKGETTGDYRLAKITLLRDIQSCSAPR